MFTPEVVNELNKVFQRKISQEEINAAVAGARAVYEKHMGKFPPVPDAVFMEMFEAFSEATKKNLLTKIQ